MLAAVILTFATTGRSAGAVYIPADEMVPEAAVPPAIPFTLHVTELVAVPFVVASNCRLSPSKMFPVAGVTTMVGEGGGGEPELAPPPPQPGKVARAASNPNSQPLA